MLENTRSQIIAFTKVINYLTPITEQQGHSDEITPRWPNN